MKKGNQKLVSIIVPVYNVERYLKECLDSLIGQTYQQVEILLIDDGSVDGSGDICDTYAKKDDRIRVFHKINEGVSSARNTGIERAEGEYLIFADADDCVHRQIVEIYMNYAENGETVLCDITTNMDDLSADYAGMISSERVGWKRFMELFRNGYVNPPFNKLYRAEIVKETPVRFAKDKNLGEDLLFNLVYFRHMKKNFRIIHAPLYYYRENREGSLSTSYRRDLFEIQQELFEALKHFLEEKDIWDEENGKIYYGMYWDRLYLTVQMCRAYEKEHTEERRLQEILQSGLWQKIWDECERRGLANWKRRGKAVMLKLYRLKI